MPFNLQSLPRPTWLLVKPTARLMRNHRPFYSSPLKMASTPERIEAGWWSQSQTRDYFIGEGEDHALYWVYRERIVGGGCGTALVPAWVVWVMEDDLSQLVVHDLEHNLIDALERRTASNGRNPEAEHCEILRATLLDQPEKRSCKQLLARMPYSDDDNLFDVR